MNFIITGICTDLLKKFWSISNVGKNNSILYFTIALSSASTELCLGYIAPWASAQ